jgi:hypothetical protein
LASLPIASTSGRINSKIDGVQKGAQTYSFRDRPLDAAIDAMREIGLGECQLSQVHTEPKLKREELRHWRVTVPLEEFRKIRNRFETAGIPIFANTIDFNATLSVAKRIAPPAKKYRVTVAFHGRSDIKDVVHLKDRKRNGLSTARTGRPLNITISRSAAAMLDGFTNNQRPGLVYGVPIYPADQTINTWPNPTAFATPAKFTWGDPGRFIARGPAFYEVNTGIERQGHISERLRLSFGRITSVLNTGTSGAGTPLRTQFMMRLEF